MSMDDQPGWYDRAHARASDLFGADEEWDNSAAARILLILTGGLLIQAGFRIWATLQPSSLLGGISVILLYAAAVQLIIFGATALDMRKWGAIVAYSTLFILLLAVSASLLRNFMPRLGTDAMMFSAYSAELIANGENPYVHGMGPAFDMAGTAREFSTPRIDGTNVKSLSYPAGSVLAFVPQTLLPDTPLGLRFTPMLFVFAIGALIAYDAPNDLALAGVVALMIGRNLMITAAGGVFDVIWVLPVLLSMREWYRERWFLAAIWFGVAAGTKQTPWAIAPFLAIWLAHDSRNWRQYASRAGRCLAGGSAGFLALNLPFIVADPGAWMAGVLTPISGSAPMVHQGSGLTLTTVLGVYPLTTGWHTLTVVTATGLLLLACVLWPEQFGWAIWVAPLAIYFLHYRSLNSYFTAFIPIAVYGMLASKGELTIPTPATADETAGRWLSRARAGDD